MGLLDGIKDLGVDDLTEKEVACLLRVLTKPELEGAIEVGEFIQIMENLGMMGQEQDQDQMQQSNNLEESGAPSGNDTSA